MKRGAQLVRVAIALTGDRQSGEEPLQAGLEGVLGKPRTVESGTEGRAAHLNYRDARKKRLTG